MYVLQILIYVVLLSTFVNGEKYSCRDQVMPANLEAELQSYERQTLDAFYVHPYYSSNAVIRIKNFDQLRCGLSDIKIFNGPRYPGNVDKRSEIDWVCHFIIIHYLLFTPELFGNFVSH